MDSKDIKKPKLYSMPDAAKKMGIHYNTLYRMVKSGKIKPLNVARTGSKPIFAFTAEDIQSYHDNLSNPNHRYQAVHK